MPEGFESVAALNERMMNVTDEGIMAAGDARDKKNAAYEFKKSLRLAQLRNRITRNSLNYAKKLEKADQRYLDSLIKLAKTYEEERKRAMYESLKRSFALGANSGLEVPRGGKGGGGAGGGRGGGFGGALGVGVGAAATFLLVAAINKMVQQSKIVATVEKSINQALGMFLDLILIPFVPMIAYGLIQMYYGLMELANGINTIQKEGLLKVIFSFDIGGFLGEFVKPLLDWLFDPLNPEKALNFGLWLVGFFLSPLVGLSAFLINGILRVLFGENAPTLNDIFANLKLGLTDFLKDIMANPLVKAILNFVFGLDNLKIPNIVIPILLDLITPEKTDRGNSGAGGMGGFGGNGNTGGNIFNFNIPSVGQIMDTISKAMFQQG